jgi:hypothetical protein
VRNWEQFKRESGEDYLYPQGFFMPIELPKALEKAVLEVA